MPEWKKNIFINAIRARMEREGKTAEAIVDEYTKLTNEEKTLILKEV